MSSKHRKREQKKKMIIKGKDLIINSSGKLGRHLDVVKTGTGPHKSKKDYKRRSKHKNRQFDNIE